MDKEKILEQITPLLRTYAKAAERRGAEFDDVMQEAYIIALNAMDAYDEEFITEDNRKATLETYIISKVKQELPNRIVTDALRIIHIPRWIQEDVFVPVERMRDKFVQTYARYPTTEEVLADTELQEELQRRAGIRRNNRQDKQPLTADRVRNFIEAALTNTSEAFISFDEDEANLSETLVNEEEESVEEQVDNVLLKEAIEQATEILSDDEYNVLNMRFGLSAETITLREIGEKLGYSAVSVLKIERRALDKLRKYPKARTMLRNWR